MIGNTRRLLITNKPKPDESFMGYIIRLTALNRYYTPVWILRMAGFQWGLVSGNECCFLFSGSTDLSLLSTLTQVDTVTLESLFYRPADPSFNTRGKQLFFGLPVSQYMIHPYQPKICPDCLKQSAYWRRVWDLVPATVCPIHKRLLLDVCPHCKSKIRLRRVAVTTCTCGFDWRTDLAYTPLEERELKLTRYIYRLCKIETCPSINDEVIGNPLSRLCLDDLLSAVFLIAGQYQGTNDVTGKTTTSSISHSEMHALLVRAFSVFENWPNNYYEFLEWKRSQAKYIKGRVTGVEKEFNNLNDALNHNRHLRSCELDFMRTAFEEYLKTRWSGGYARHVKCNKPVSMRLSSGKFLTRTETARRLGISPEWIDKLISNGKLKAVIRHREKMRFVLIELASVETLESEIRQQLGINEVAQMLGLGERAINSLIDFGCLQLRRGLKIDGFRTLIFDRGDVEDFLNRLRARIPEDYLMDVSGKKIQLCRTFGRFRRLCLQCLKITRHYRQHPDFVGK